MQQSRKALRLGRRIEGRSGGAGTNIETSEKVHVQYDRHLVRPGTTPEPDINPEPGAHLTYPGAPNKHLGPIRRTGLSRCLGAGRTPISFGLNRGFGGSVLALRLAASLVHCRFRSGGGLTPVVGHVEARTFELHSHSPHHTPE